MEVCLIVLSRLSAANSHDRLIQEPDNRGPEKRGVQRCKKLQLKRKEIKTKFCLKLTVFANKLNIVD